MQSDGEPLRVLCVGETWLGSDARAAFMGFRRLGHTIRVVDDTAYIPTAWTSTFTRAVRRVTAPLLIRELTRTLVRLATQFRPQCLFVFKGTFVHPNVLRHYKALGIPTVNYYPDVSFMAHGRNLPRALPLYDHVFTTKSFGLVDLRTTLGMSNATYLEHGFDPDLHRPIEITSCEDGIYSSQVVFVGTWSPKKERFLESLKRAMPHLQLRIWGCQWSNMRSEELRGAVAGDEVVGDEYVKALRGAKIALGLLSEQRKGASSGDLTTARTFQIPACGVFMLHERTPDVTKLFTEDREAAYFESAEELATKVAYYLDDGESREAIAAAGHLRAWSSGYSADDRMQTIVDWLRCRRINSRDTSVQCDMSPLAPCGGDWILGADSRA